MQLIPHRPYRVPLKMELIAPPNPNHSYFVETFHYAIEFLCKAEQTPTESQLSALEDFCAMYRPLPLPLPPPLPLQEQEQKQEQESLSNTAAEDMLRQQQLAADAKAEAEADAELQKAEEEKEEYRRKRAEERAARGRGITMSEIEAVVGHADMNIEDVLKEIHKNRSQEAQEQHEAARVWAASDAEDAAPVLCTWDFNIPHVVPASPPKDAEAQKKKVQAAFLRKVQPWWPFMRVKNMLKCFHNADIPKRVSYMHGLELMAKAASIDVESLVGMSLPNYIKLAGVSQYDLIARGWPFTRNEMMCDL